MGQTNDSQDLEREIKKRGHRLTKARSTILDLFKKAKAPLTAQELLRSLKKSHKTTVYRELDFLVKEKFIHKVDFGDQIKRYELMSQAHHHHVICIKCNTVKDVQIKRNICDQNRAIAKQTGFEVTRHALEFFGLCNRCKKAKKSILSTIPTLPAIPKIKFKPFYNK